MIKHSGLIGTAKELAVVVHRSISLVRMRKSTIIPTQDRQLQSTFKSTHCNSLRQLTLFLGGGNPTANCSVLYELFPPPVTISAVLHLSIVYRSMYRASSMPVPCSSFKSWSASRSCRFNQQDTTFGTVFCLLHTHENIQFQRNNLRQINI